MTDASAFGGSSVPDPGTFGSGLSPQPDPAQDAAPQAPQSSGSSFGQGLKTLFGGPQYTAPDPHESALDQTADTLNQRVQRANQIANNPVLQFFNPEGVQAARNFVPAATEQLQKIKAQKADMMANRQQAETLGLSPGQVPDEASQADRTEVAVGQALKGNLRSFQGLQVVDPQRAGAIQDQVHEVVAGHLDKAQLAFDSLAGMTNQGQYAAKLKQLQNDGTLSDLTALGMKVPTTFDEFNASKGAESKALREAKVASQTLKAQLEERANGTPMEKKEAETYAGRLTTESGEQIGNINWQRINGKRVAVVNGMADIRDLGSKFSFMTPDQRKAFQESRENAVPKAEIEKTRSFNRVYDLATKDAKGNAIPAEGADDGRGGKVYFNTNPNVQQGVAEGLASMLRGGAGGATSGLLNIETSKRGYVQTVIDKIISGYAGGINTLSAEQVRPYLSQLTQDQMRAVMDGLKSYNTQSIGDRLSDTAKRVGELGGTAADLGLSKGEATGVDAAIEAGRQSTIARFAPRARSTSGGDGGIFLDSPPPVLVTKPDVPGTEHPPVPPPVAKSASPPAPSTAGNATPPGPGPAGGGGSPTYNDAVQRIESGRDNPNRWTATTPGSSASGAYQFIDKTWQANKPAGAPDRAKDATPEQQTQAFNTFTAKNAASLKQAGLEVNDTNLYVAHNLGSGGASALLRASPNADARTVVGEAAAKNNPLFFKGKPNVATVLSRYQANMAQDISDSANRTPQPKANLPDVGAAPWTGRTSPAGDHIASPEERAASPVVENAPAVGSTIGAVGGSLAGGPAGGIAGGAAGGGAGQAFKDYMQGRDQSPAKIAKQAALGGVLGVASEARPVISAAARVAGVAGVDAGATAAEGGNTADVIGSAVEGGAYALGGETLGRFVSSAGATAYKALSRYTTGAQQELSASAGKLAEARKVLETTEPKLPGEGSGPNPKYEAAKKQADEATQQIEDHGQKPDDMVHAYEQAKAGVSSGEAQVMKGATAEKRDIGAGYDELRSQVKDTGVGAPKPGQPVVGGPLAQIRTADNPTGKVPEQFRPEAEHAEMLIKASAKDWGEKWQQLQNAGTELIQKRMSFLQNADKPSADAMDALFKGVRKQQEAAAQYVFGPERAKQIISNLETLDTRYAKVMNATAGMDYGKMSGILAQGNTPASRELQKNFTEFAKGDPSALRAFNAMKAGAKGDWKSEAALMGPVIAGEVANAIAGGPLGAGAAVVSGVIGGHRLYKLVQGYMNARVLGKAVTFKDFLANEIKTSLPNLGVTQRAVAQRQ